MQLDKTLYLQYSHEQNSERPVYSIVLQGNARPTLASGLPLDDCYEVVLPLRFNEKVGVYNNVY